MEEKYWKDPFVFRPERFINDDGKLIQDTHFMPFGTGKCTFASLVYCIFLSSCEIIMNVINPR